MAKKKAKKSSAKAAGEKGIIGDLANKVKKKAKDEKAKLKASLKKKAAAKKAKLKASLKKKAEGKKAKIKAKRKLTIEPLTLAYRIILIDKSIINFLADSKLYK